MALKRTISRRHHERKICPVHVPLLGMVRTLLVCSLRSRASSDGWPLVSSQSPGPLSNLIFFVVGWLRPSCQCELVAPSYGFGADRPFGADPILALTQSSLDTRVLPPGRTSVGAPRFVDQRSWLLSAFLGLDVQIFRELYRHSHFDLITWSQVLALLFVTI